MINRLNPWQSYRNVATQTAPPGQLVLMLFDGALKFMEKARLGFGEEDPRLFNETIHNNLQKAQAILTELNSSLNLRDGGEFSQTMRRLYNYFDERLQTANIHKQSEPLLEVIARVNTLRNAWAEMLHSQNNSTLTDEIRAALVAQC